MTNLKFIIAKVLGLWLLFFLGGQLSTGKSFKVMARSLQGWQRLQWQQWNRLIKFRRNLPSTCFSQFSSVAQSCPILCDPMNRSTPGFPVHHQFPGFTQTHVHQVGDAIQPSHLLSSPSPSAPSPSQHHGLFQWVNSSHEVAKVLEFQLQHQSFQWTPRTDLL